MIETYNDQKYIDILSGNYHIYDHTRMKFIENIMRHIIYEYGYSMKYLSKLISIDTLSKIYMYSDMNTYFIGSLNKYVATSILVDFLYNLHMDNKNNNNNIYKYQHNNESYDFVVQYMKDNFDIVSILKGIVYGKDVFNLDDSGYQKKIQWKDTCSNDIRKGIRKCIDLDKCQIDIEVEKACRSPYFVTLKEFGTMEPIERIFQLKRELEVLKVFESGNNPQSLGWDDMESIEKELETVGTNNLSKLKDLKIRIFRIAKTIPNLIQ